MLTVLYMKRKRFEMLYVFFKISLFDIQRINREQ